MRLALPLVARIPKLWQGDTWRALNALAGSFHDPFREFTRDRVEFTCSWSFIFTQSRGLGDSMKIPHKGPAPGGRQI